VLAHIDVRLKDEDYQQVDALFRRGIELGQRKALAKSVYTAEPLDVSGPG